MLQVTPREICDIKFVKPKRTEAVPTLELIRKRQSSSTSTSKIYMGPQDSPCVPKFQLYSAVRSCLPRCSLFTVIPSTAQQDMFGTTYSTNTINQPSSSSSRSIDNVTDTAVTVNNIIPYSEASSSLPSCGLPLPLTELYRKEYQHLDDKSLQQLIDDVFLNTIQISIKDCQLIEESTRSQRDSTDWFAQ